ncbi:NUDIX domain-containing protein [Halosimplex litoreum]|uniref:NUDIX domain-containing protein n=1 Tax=Halosimplex litoreum TaxID=1198301 RepID=A0A7T3G017_9EURY|nr:NUDIX domain-containing protein [Halosimplex litoreum]QPV63875.1 NUDIX domain-containing protein [Halosimplex litoreum]
MSEDDTAVTAPDPETVAARDGVTVDERTRAFPDEQFDALRDRYERIDGVVLVGVTRDDGAVLLQGGDNWSPPGGEVDPGQDWASAAESAVGALTGVEVTVEAAELVEYNEFHREGDSDDSFRAPVVHFGASLAGDADSFREDPTVADDWDHPAFNPEAVDLAWFDAVPADADPSHEDHIALYFD